jgi:hypothetical protein
LAIGQVNRRPIRGHGVDQRARNLITVPHKQIVYTRHVKHKLCAVCGMPHNRYRDSAHSSFCAYCHSCHAAYMRRTRPLYQEMTKEQKRKANARAYANAYQRRGKLAKMPCEKCGSPLAEKHHNDYGRPLTIRWLCRPCHLAAHRAIDPGLGLRSAIDSCNR